MISNTEIKVKHARGHAHKDKERWGGTRTCTHMPTKCTCRRTSTSGMQKNKNKTSKNMHSVILFGCQVNKPHRRFWEVKSFVIQRLLLMPPPCNKITLGGCFYSCRNFCFCGEFISRNVSNLQAESKIRMKSTTCKPHSGQNMRCTRSQPVKKY